MMAARKPVADRSGRSEQNVKVVLHDDEMIIEESLPVSAEENDEQVLIDSPEALESRIAGIKGGTIASRPVLISRKMLRRMDHIPAFSTVIFNPFGPTVDTVTLSYFREPQGKQYLIRRSLHPFSEERNQVIASVPDYPDDDEGYRGFLVRFTADFIAHNGVSKSSKDLWGRELISCIPTGVLVDESSVFSMGAILGFSHLLSRAEKLLEMENERIETHGSDFWKATPQLHEILQQIQDGYEPPVLEFPDIEEPISNIEASDHPNFLSWWEKITQSVFQTDLFEAIQTAWNGSVHQFLGGRVLRSASGASEFGDDDNDDDFYKWWALFDPKKRK